MSEKYQEYKDRTPEELEALVASQMRPTGQKFRDYVAPPAPGYDVHGLWHTWGSHHRTGYATHALSLQWMLSRSLGIPTALVPHRNVDIDIERFPSDRYDMLFQWVKEGVGHPKALFCSWPPEVAVEMEDTAPKIIPYCAFEGDRVSDYCRSLATGPVFAGIWVVSEFVRDAFVQSNVPESVVHVVRPMLTEGPWTMIPLDVLAEKKNRPVTHDDPFIFGVLGTWQKRKGMHDLVRAYFSAFARDQPVKLVLKTSAFGENLTIKKFKEKLTAEIAEIAKEFGDYGFPMSGKMPRIGFELGTDQTDQQVIEWLGDLDCYANPSYGEGLGIPHVWAKAQGVPMVTSAYGAVGQMVEEIRQKSGSTRDTTFLYQLTEVGPEVARIALMFDKRTRWGTYKLDDLAAGMQTQFDRGRYFDRAAAVATREMFGAENCLPAVRAGLSRIVPEEWVMEWKLA